MMKLKFNELAYYHQAIYSSDGEEIRNALKKVTFECYEYDLMQTNQHSPLEKILAKTQTMALCTYDPIAKSISPDDTIEYNEVLYSVISVKKIKSLIHPSRYEYIITMQIGG